MVDSNVKIELNAVIVAVIAGQPHILTGPGNTLPSGPFATGHRTLEQGLRDWAGLPLGYVEQLYTFADSDRKTGGNRLLSIGYLALMQEAALAAELGWSPWYRHFPWEDRRDGPSPVLARSIMPRLAQWQKRGGSKAIQQERAARIDIAFPADAKRWNEELVLQRYELLWEAGLVPESGEGAALDLGLPLAHDHRRIVATAMARLRAKIKYRPVVFELLPDAFTLLQLQETVEALSGLRLHKQNFRRLVEAQGLVEETGAMERGMGRPAKLFAFRRTVLQERAAAGTKLPRST